VKLTYATNSADRVTGARSLSAESTSALLSGIISECEKRLVVFDLDSTLLDNRPRNAVITREFGKLHDQSKLKQAKAEHWQDWSARHAMLSMGLSHDEIERLIETYTSYWEERFFTSQYCQYDEAISGAVFFVRQLEQSGAIIRYLTGRHEAMRPGTTSSLTKLGFPAPGLIAATGVNAAPGVHNVELIMKSVQSIPDDDYKKKAMLDIVDVENDSDIYNNEILAAFDNEPYHINAYRQTFPEATCIHLNTDHSMRRISLLNGIVSISNFIL